ncbi:NADH-ubiquinone oxidoreductase-F iron-sulfur binding region domain-containing protein [Mycobacterium sp.]|uniref:NADH-ubiquinone oxidoreductase-F iron-sulfur binding region domain-containing protein n=1 Tax=Mycobacterium sp. TaxID=1785 RepID=UPI002B9DD17E|nr:NADH-ubiquinone oxidoreductase-F iron-sulfur binding region domain-containing protein [Mycobacterium sp.]HKP42731.1 NADH-ubiquinone oxidoreductase-F iron-sulfur binding region domain-containing protein [Mycobacterium sp.]
MPQVTNDRLRADAAGSTDDFERCPALARLDCSREHTVGHHAAIEPRIAVGAACQRSLTLADELSLGTYGVPRVPSIIDELRLAGLKGKGGACFPADIKWLSVAQGDGAKVVVANGEEGEPFSRKDRWLLTHRPHLVIDGLLLACDAVGAHRGVIYLSHDETVVAVQRALAELAHAEVVSRRVALEVHTVEPTYVAGEESAACRAINGGPALPTAKPPRPFEQGVDGRPTLVSNVETLAHAAWIGRHGSAEFRRYGTSDSPGTTLMTLNGACRRPGVYEVPFGLTIREMFSLAGGFDTPATALMMGGWFSGLAPVSLLDIPCTPELLKSQGTGFGCGSITVLGAEDDPLDVAAEIATWYAEQSARQCGVCVNGTAAIRDSIAALRDDRSLQAEVDKLARWGSSLVGRGACSFLDGAAAWARTAPAVLGVQPTQQ